MRVVSTTFCADISAMYQKTKVSALDKTLRNEVTEGPNHRNIMEDYMHSTSKTNKDASDQRNISKICVQSTEHLENRARSAKIYKTMKSASAHKQNQ